MSAAPRRFVLRFFREQVRPYAGLQLQTALVLIVGVFLELLDPLILRALIDRALGDGDRPLLLLLGGLLALALLFRTAFRLLSVWLTSYSGLRILFDFRQRTYEHVQRLAPSFFRDERQGDTLARLTTDIDILQRTAAHTLVHGSHDVLVLAGIGGLLFWLDASLAGILLLVYPLLVLALMSLNRRLRREGYAAREAIGGLYTFLEERLSLVGLIREFGRETAEARRHVSTSRPWIKTNLTLSVLGAGQVSLADLMTTGGTIVIFVVGGARALDGDLSLGTLIAFYTLAGRVHRPLSGLIDINVDLQVARASLERVYELLDQTPEPPEAADATVPAEVRGNYVLRGAGMRWPDGTEALREIDLELRPGETVALVGPSGGGKSTLGALLARIADPTSGQVELDGLDLRQWKQRELVRTVGRVPQQTQLFHDSLAANLRLAKPDATDAELVQVLEDVELAAFLEDLPEGLETPVGEQGARLSGGEAQRLALARALLADPRVLVLDESTSALDTRTERRVLTRLRERMRGRTCVLIAHRLAALRDVDRVVVLKGGRIVEDGTPDDLRRVPGVYRDLLQHSGTEAL